MLSPKRKTFVAREDLINRLGEIAKRQGFSLYDKVNEIFRLTIQAEEMGVNLGEFVEEKGVLKAAKEDGFILGLENLWYDMVELAYKKRSKDALEKWFEAGVWFAKRYVMGETKDPFGAFKRDLEIFTWNAPQLKIEESGIEVSISIISPRFPESYTVLFASFLEGALQVFGYKVASKEVSRGRINLKAGRGDAYVHG